MAANKLLSIVSYERDGKRQVRWRPIVAIVFLLSFLMFYTYKVITCPDERIQRDVEKFFLEIQPMPGSTAVASHPITIYKPCIATIGNYYNVKADDDEIRQYYNDELAKHGWAFHKEKKVFDWEKDYGGKEFFYCKGEYRAIIQTASREEAEFGWTFALDISYEGYNCSSSQK